MNWYKAKTVLIFFFVVMNLLLLTSIIYSTNKTSFITPEILHSTVEVLSKNDIAIDSNLIPIKNPKISYIDVQNIIQDTSNFASIILKADKSELKFENNAFLLGNQSLTIDGDMFHFKTSEPIAPSNSDKINDANVEQQAISIMKNYGFELDKNDISFTNSDGLYYVAVTKTINQISVFNSTLTIILNENGLLEFKGIWFEEIPQSQWFVDKIPLKSVTGVLVEFILNEDRPQANITINNLELGYQLEENNVYHKSISLIPVWKITLSDNSQYYMDAREYQS